MRKTTINKAVKSCISTLKGPLILATSGGPDSQCLLKVVAHVVDPANCIAVGIDHGLRPEASRELDLVEETAKACGMRFERVSIVVPKGPSVQAQARDARYAALAAKAKEHGSQYILTGHNYDDQVETLLIKLLRGTPPKKMATFNYLKDYDITLVRPLMNNSREDILRYLKRWNTSFAEDPSNKSIKYLRSWVRTELLPMMETKNPQIKHNIVRFLETGNT